MAIPPEDPTRPLPPAAPPPRAAYEERVYEEPPVVVDDPGWRQVILDRLDSVRTGVAVVGVIAVIALALSVWNLLREEEDRDTRTGGVSAAQVDDLRDRTDDLESDLRNRATKEDVAAVQSASNDLGKRVDDLSGKAAGSGADNEARESLNDLSDSLSTLNQTVTDLDRRVAALEEQAEQNP